MIRKKQQYVGEAWIVTPKGEISNESFSPTRTPYCIQVKWQKNEYGRPERFERWDIKPELREKGFRSLKEMYDREDWPEGYDAFLDLVGQCRRKGIRFRKDESGAIVHPIPDEYLPEAVVSRRVTHANPNLEMPPISRPKKSEPKPSGPGRTGRQS